MTDTQLNVIIAVANTGSVAKAAQKLCMNRSTVTRNIKSTEDEFGIALFSGRGDRITLTDDAHALFPLLVRLNSAYSEMTDLAKKL